MIIGRVGVSYLHYLNTLPQVTCNPSFLTNTWNFPFNNAFMNISNTLLSIGIYVLSLDNTWLSQLSVIAIVNLLLISPINVYSHRIWLCEFAQYTWLLCLTVPLCFASLNSTSQLQLPCGTSNQKWNASVFVQPNQHHRTLWGLFSPSKSKP